MEKLYLLSGVEGIGLRTLFEDIFSALALERADDEADGEPESDAEFVPRIAIVGKPNVGKSSLVNRLLGKNRMIVSDIPGTTRDAIDVPYEFRGRRFLLIDTAGIRRKAKVEFHLETFGVIKALKALDRCHVALVMADAAEVFDDQTLRVTQYAIDRGRAVVWVFNKIDTIKDRRAWRAEVDRQIDYRLRHLEFIPQVEISARTGHGVTQLFSVTERVAEAHNRRIDTGRLNRLLADTVERHTPPVVRNRQLKFYYATQASVRPPSFVLFTNMPTAVHFSYQRYLTNAFREAEDFAGAPIRLIFKKHSEKK